ncbi:MAG: hypothetical protein GY708_05845 [Actinomycetia bacterium]|nr:hypothetical protein [Actinomycetes bacterium]
MYLSLEEAARIDGRATHKTLLRMGEVTALRESGQLDRITAALLAHADDTWTYDRGPLSCTRSISS